jgi:TonB family protein
MSRLQKKCLIATAGGHLLLILVLVFGSAFFVSRSKPDESQILTVIPANLIDAAFSSGVAGAQPPPPQPVQPVQPPTPVPPRPEPPPPKPPEPQPEPPKPTLVERVQEFFKPEPVKPAPDDLKNDEPELKTSKTEPKKIKVNLDPVVRKTTKTPDTSEAEARREAQRASEARARAFKSATSSISKNTSTATVVDMPGASTAAYASYKDALASIYYDAWTPPTDTSNDDAITKVRITIARDGTIISARIIGPSGDSRVDASVQRAIDRVKDVPPLPEGTKETERTVILNFNLKTKRMIG